MASHLEGCLARVLGKVEREKIHFLCPTDTFDDKAMCGKVTKA